MPTNDANGVSITLGPDGAMWFTEASAVKLGRIAADGSIAEYPLPAQLDRKPIFAFHSLPASSPDRRAASPPPHGRAQLFEKLGGIVAGPDGALWITAPFAKAVARVTTNGDVHVTCALFPHPSSPRRADRLSVAATARFTLPIGSVQPAIGHVGTIVLRKARRE